MQRKFCIQKLILLQEVAKYSLQQAFHWGSMTNIYLFNVFISELLVCIFFYCVEVTRSTHSDLVMVLLSQKQRTDHQLCPLEGVGSVLSAVGFNGNGLNWEPTQ